MVNDLQLNPNSTFEQRRDNSVRQNDNLMDEVYLASQFLDLPYEVNAGLTSAAKYGEAARPIARVNQRKSMGRFGLKDKHLTEDDQRRLDEAAGLDEKSLMKLVSQFHIMRSFIHLISTSQLVQGQGQRCSHKAL